MKISRAPPSKRSLAPSKAVLKSSAARMAPPTSKPSKLIPERMSDQWADMRSGISLDGFEVGGAMRAAEDFKTAFDGARERFEGGARDIFMPEVRVGAAFGNLGSRVILSSLGYEPASQD